jgi:hypothetical protein
MYKDIPVSQQNMFRAISTVDQVRESYPTIFVTRMFVTAKSEEIIEVFKGADRAMRNQVMQVMRRLDITNASKYNVLQ